jgi:hypothetical protein
VAYRCSIPTNRLRNGWRRSRDQSGSSVSYNRSGNDKHVLSPCIQGPGPLLGEIVPLVDPGDATELRRLVGEQLVDGDGVEAETRQGRGAGPAQVVQAPGDEGASSSPAADAALARAWMIALSRAALAREKPETEVSYVVLKTKSQAKYEGPMPRLTELSNGADRGRRPQGSPGVRS